VVSTDHNGVSEQPDRDAACRSAARNREDGAERREGEHDRVDQPQQDERHAIGLEPILVGVPEEEGSIEELTDHPTRLVGESIAVAAPGDIAELRVGARHVAGVGFRIGAQLLGRGSEVTDGFVVAKERRVLRHLRLRPAEAFSVRREQEVVALAPAGERGLPGHARCPDQPRDEQCGRGGGDCPGGREARSANQGGQHEQRNDEDENGSDERERRRECARGSPPGKRALLPRPGERVGRREGYECR